MTTANTPIDLDDELGFEEMPTVRKTKPVKLLGKTFRVVLDVNYWNMTNELGSDDIGAVSRLVLGMIHVDDQQAFSDTLAKVKDLDADKLWKLINKLIEVAGERPTSPPSTSPRGGSRKTSSRKSARS